MVSDVDEELRPIATDGVQRLVGVASDSLSLLARNPHLTRIWLFRSEDLCQILSLTKGSFSKADGAVLP